MARYKCLLSTYLTPIKVCYNFKSTFFICIVFKRQNSKSDIVNVINIIFINLPLLIFMLLPIQWVCISSNKLFQATIYS